MYIVIKPFSVNEAMQPLGKKITDDDFEPHLIQTFLELENIKEANDDGEVHAEDEASRSVDVKAAEAIEHIQNIGSVEELNDYVRGDARKAVQSNAETRRTELLAGE